MTDHLIAFLWHLKREWLTAGGCDALENQACYGGSLAHLEIVDPHTLASARELAERLVGDTFGRDNASAGELEE